MTSTDVLGSGHDPAAALAPPLSGSAKIALRRFEPEDQEAVKELILTGLEEHWGWRDLTANPDLDDIATSYACGIFVVAVSDGDIVGSGALLLRGEGVGEIVRMSVAEDYRRRGIGGAILAALRSEASASGLRQLILETTATWRVAMAFYLSHGFRFTHEDNGNAYFALDLDAQR